jgi:hypothetical protein
MAVVVVMVAVAAVVVAVAAVVVVVTEAYDPPTSPPRGCFQGGPVSCSDDNCGLTRRRCF